MFTIKKSKEIIDINNIIKPNNNGKIINQQNSIKPAYLILGSVALANIKPAAPKLAFNPVIKA